MSALFTNLSSVSTVKYISLPVMPTTTTVNLSEDVLNVKNWIVWVMLCPFQTCCNVGTKNWFGHIQYKRTSHPLSQGIAVTTGIYPKSQHFRIFWHVKWVIKCFHGCVMKTNYPKSCSSLRFIHLKDFLLSWSYYPQEIIDVENELLKWPVIFVAELNGV